MLMLAITRRRRTTSLRDVSFYAQADHELCAALCEPGAVMHVLRRRDGRGVVLLLNTATGADARDVLDALPGIPMGASAYDAIDVEPIPGLPEGTFPTATKESRRP